MHHYLSFSLCCSGAHSHVMCVYFHEKCITTHELLLKTDFNSIVRISYENGNTMKRSHFQCNKCAGGEVIDGLYSGVRLNESTSEIGKIMKLRYSNLIHDYCHVKFRSNGIRT